MDKKFDLSELPIIEPGNPAWTTIRAWADMNLEKLREQREELIDGVEEGGVAMYLDHAEASNVNLFI